jgi:ribonuclease HI
MREEPTTVGNPTFTCVDCGSTFSLSPAILRRYPGWTPKRCLTCRGQGKQRPNGELNLTTAEVVEQFTKGPDSGIFSDGSCDPNPGPGGWGVVKALQGRIVAERAGHDASTTNNRMELTALIEAFKLVAPDEEIDIYTDSQLCFNTITKWAPAWERKGWTRGKKHEQVANLDLVRELHALSQQHPRVTLRWIKAHQGSRWNEYADSLSTAYTRRVRQSLPYPSPRST